jgi:hypothetical protein
MKAQIFIFFIVAFTTTAFAQTPTKKPETVPVKTEFLESPVYQLFATKNMWTFLKLDTRNGQIWQVQFDVSGSNRGQTVLNSIPLVTKEKELKGRFTLYQTENIYNFLLLDQIDGTVYQVQWSMDEKNRVVIQIF